jgi:hypothetical protein
VTRIRRCDARREVVVACRGWLLDDAAETPEAVLDSDARWRVPSCAARRRAHQMWVGGGLAALGA